MALHDTSVADLLEGVLLHVFEGKHPFSSETLATIAQLKRIYGLDLTAEDSHALQDLEGEAEQPKALDAGN